MNALLAATPSDFSAPTADPVPAGFRIDFDADTRWLNATALFGGSPARVLRLSPEGRRAAEELERGPVGSPATALLARRLLDTGLAHPVPPEVRRALDVAVVVPAFERPALLDACLGALGDRYPVVVVDDGSVAREAIAAVAQRRGARLLRRAENGGPGPARNTALAAVTSELVAFLDSDCLPGGDWIADLAGHFADPLVAAVAPRVLAANQPDWRSGRPGGLLDMGARPARVAPGTRVSYVPTAALLVRRAALVDVARDGAVFDAGLRLGEDVDLVWRLGESGWRVRYDPSVVVGHQDPATHRGRMARRFGYGTTAGPLARRHPHALAPLVLFPWPALTVAGLVARRPVLVGLGYAGAVASITRRLRRAGIPVHGVARATAVAVLQTGLGIGRYGTQFATPVLAAGLFARRPHRRRWERRAVCAMLLLAPALDSWRTQGRPRGLTRHVVGQLAQEIAYGAGVWVGCARARTLRPVRPAWRRRPLPIDPPAPNPTRKDPP